MLGWESLELTLRLNHGWPLLETITELLRISTETLSNIYIQSYSNLAADNISK